MWIKGDHGYFEGSTPGGGAGKPLKLQRRHYNAMAGAIAAAVKGDAARTKSIIEDNKASKFTKAERELTKKLVGRVLKASDKNAAINAIAQSLRGSNAGYDPSRFAKAAKGESNAARDKPNRRNWKTEDIPGKKPIDPMFRPRAKVESQPKEPRRDPVAENVAWYHRPSWVNVPGTVSLTNKADNAKIMANVDRVMKEHKQNFRDLEAMNKRVGRRV